MNDFESYIQPELLILIGVLYFIGEAIKGSDTKDKYIPLIIGGIGIVMATLYVIATVGFSLMAIFTGFTQGVLCAGCAVYVNQIIKQNKK